VKELISVGGASNSRVWTQIKADITGKTIHVPYSDHATTLGAALLAGIGTGVYQSFKDAVQKTVRIQRTHIPSLNNHCKYEKFFKLYKELYQNLKDSYEILDRIVNQ
jgi:xylulokinase